MCLCLRLFGLLVKARPSRAAFVHGWSAPSTRSQSASVRSSSRIASTVRPAAVLAFSILIAALCLFSAAGIRRALQPRPGAH
jgi:hypothetical protein